MKKLAVVVAAPLLACAASTAIGDDEKYRLRLSGFEEVPALSTTGSARFKAEINRREDAIDYELSYRDLVGAVTQAHVHFGQMGVNGGISFFLCTNLGNGPAGTQPCPPAPATVSGRITAADVIGPAGQGIAAGELAEIVAAIRAGIAYANVHSAVFPAGEVRAQFPGNTGDHDHHRHGRD
jgi:hypothetical protein